MVMTIQDPKFSTLFFLKDVSDTNESIRTEVIEFSFITSDIDSLWVTSVSEECRATWVCPCRLPMSFTSVNGLSSGDDIGSFAGGTN